MAVMLCTVSVKELLRLISKLYDIVPGIFFQLNTGVKLTPVEALAGVSGAVAGAPI